ncbi:lipopolysaccharide biosynthesis protein [Streptomyces chengmaiensis]
MSDTTRLRKPPPAEAEPASTEHAPVHGDAAGASHNPPHGTSRSGSPDEPAPRRGGGDSLFRNAYALMLSTGVSAGLGLGFWLVAARYYTEEAVGQGSAAIAAMRLLASLTATTMIGAVVRYVPRAGRATGPLVWRAYAVSSLVVCLAAVAFLLTLDLWGPSYAPLDGIAAGLVFTAACVGWALLTLQDGVLTGLRRAFWVPVGNAVFSIGKLLLLIVFASLLPVLGIFVSWAAAIALSTLPLAWLVFRRLIPRQAAADRDREPPSVRDIGRFLAGDSVGALFSLAMINLLPVMVAVRFDAAHNGFFYIAYTVGGTMEFMAINMASSLTAHASHSPESLASGVRGALRRMAVLLVPVVLVLMVFAPQILAPFGADYAQHGTTVLRLLAAAALPRVLVELYIGVLRVQGRTGVLAALQGTMCFLVLGSAALLMGPAGISGAGLAMLLSMTAMALLSVPGLRAALAGRGRRLPPSARLGYPACFGRGRADPDGRAGRAGSRPGPEEYGTTWARRAAEYAEEYGDDWARRTAYLRGVHDDTATPAFGIPVYLAPADPWGQGGDCDGRWHEGRAPARDGKTAGWGHEHPDGRPPGPAHTAACGPEPDGPCCRGSAGPGERLAGGAGPRPACGASASDGAAEGRGQGHPDGEAGGWAAEHPDSPTADWGGHDADATESGRSGGRPGGAAAGWGADHPAGPSALARPGGDGPAQAPPHGRVPGPASAAAHGSPTLSGGPAGPGGRRPGPDDRGWGQSPAEHPAEGSGHSPAHRRADGPSGPSARGHLDGPGDGEGAISGEDPSEARLATSLWLLLGLAAGLFWTPLLSTPAIGGLPPTGARLLDALPPLTVTAGVLLIVVHSAALSLLRPRPGLLAATLGVTFAALHGAPAALGRIPEPVNSAWYEPLAGFLAAAAALDSPEALLRWLPTVCQLLALLAVLSILRTAGLPVAAQWGTLWLLAVCGWALQRQLAPLALPLQLLLACAAAALYAVRAVRARRTAHATR